MSMSTLEKVVPTCPLGSDESRRTLGPVSGNSRPVCLTWSAPQGDAEGLGGYRQLADRHCQAHSQASEPYFAWHRTTIFRGDI